MDIPKRALGKTGVEVTILGHEREAGDLIRRAVDLGINYFESARAYSGSESYYGRSLRERRKKIFLTSKSHARSKRGARLHLEETLRNMKTDHLDLWQVHDVRTEEEMEEIFGPQGALEAFVEARDKGLVRFIGVTGHHDPLITKRCLERFEFDTVLIPVNPAEPAYKSYLTEVIPPAKKKGMGIVGMKVYFRGFAGRLPWFKTMEPFFRFALSQPIATAVVGCDDIEQLEENVKLAGSFAPMTGKESQELIANVSSYARELMYYKP
jgi:predicted aldo/keto reductase-like oxidoreductase